MCLDHTQDSVVIFVQPPWSHYFLYLNRYGVSIIGGIVSVVVVKAAIRRLPVVGLLASPLLGEETGFRGRAAAAGGWKWGPGGLDMEVSDEDGRLSMKRLGRRGAVGGGVAKDFGDLVGVELLAR